MPDYWPHCRRAWWGEIEGAVRGGLFEKHNWIRSHPNNRCKYIITTLFSSEFYKVGTMYGGAMPLPDKKYYYLEEMLLRWAVKIHDVKYYAENGLLKIAVWYDGIIESGDYRQFSCGKICEVPTNVKNHHGLVTLGMEQCRYLFKIGEITDGYFHKTEKNYCKIHKSDNLLMPIAKSDIVICKNELQRFEQIYDLALDNKESVPDDGLIVKNNYEEVKVGGVTYQFGPTLSLVIKHLHEASKTSSPWVHGKILLAQANSELFKLSDLCKRHPAWGTLIISDRRGKYRLKI